MGLVKAQNIQNLVKMAEQTLTLILITHNSSVKIGPLVPGKKIFKVFLPYMGISAILVM